jgi:hypothetical protein
VAVGDDGDVVVAFDLETVGLKRFGLATTRHRRIVRLHQALEPLPDLRGGISPLTAIAGMGMGNDYAAGNQRVPSGMWLELARRDLRRIESI